MTKLLMTYKPYSTIVVPFPFTDSAQTKKRPAVVVSSEHHQNKTSHITLLMITTAKHSQWYYLMKRMSQYNCIFAGCACGNDINWHSH
jgi:hypothetical protein